MSWSLRQTRGGSDRRYAGSGAEQLVKDEEIDLVMRSVILQGMAALPPEALPKHLSGLIPAVTAIRDAATASGYSPAAFCMRFMLQTHAEISVVFGVLSARQLDAFEEVLNGSAIDEALIERVIRGASLNDLSLIDPRQWPRSP